MPVVVDHPQTRARIVEPCDRRSGGVHPSAAALFLESVVTPAVRTN